MDSPILESGEKRRVSRPRGSVAVEWHRERKNTQL